MYSIHKPSRADLNAFLRNHDSASFTYSYVGGTRGDAPVGFSVGRHRVLLGYGNDVYDRGKNALEQWQMFPPQFVDLIWPGPIEVDRVVATLFYAPGFWTLNPCRIVYTIDDATSTDGDRSKRFGFAYGTIGNHLACGEERFVVEHNLSNDTVSYEVYCFSRPAHWISKLAYPYLRIQQHRFRALSALAMQRAAATVV